ncbi:hypothetical protein H0E87_014356 [Populus deltoides]|jgi:prefoldin alpha subunit|uniref:Uncharacterized protein n=1 Tax=Populus deltoides TaxID=3696 RepID=A0A8T2YDB9_POPDE|nr:hypothetical protein H0E87_014356 [Populus deltoides]
MASSKGVATSPAAARASDMEKMSIEQLKAVKEQTDLEFNLLQDSLNNIKTATGRLEVAATSLNDLSHRPQGKPFIAFLLKFLFFLLVLKVEDWISMISLCAFVGFVLWGFCEN